MAQNHNKICNAYYTRQQRRCKIKTNSEITGQLGYKSYKQ